MVPRSLKVGLALLSAPVAALAGEPRMGLGLHAGGGYSLGLLAAPGTGLGLSYCFGVDWRTNDLFGYALEFAGYGGSDTTVGLLPATASFTEVSLQGKAYLRRKYYVGLGLGWQSQTVTTTPLFTGTVVGSGLSIAPLAGYVYDFGDGFTLSPELAIHASLASSLTLWASVLFRLAYTL